MLRRFVLWIARKLEPPKPPKRIARIQYTDENGRECVGQITGVAGLYLDVRPITDSGLQARLIGECDAVDRELFWEQWRAWGGELFYPDGRRYDPTL